MIFTQNHFLVKAHREVMAQLSQLESKMAAVDDELAAIKASLDTINTGVTALLAKIAAMPTAGLTAAQQAALDGIATEAAGIATAANPVTASTPAPAPAPATPTTP